MDGTKPIDSFCLDRARAARIPLIAAEANHMFYACGGRSASARRRASSARKASFRLSRSASSSFVSGIACAPPRVSARTLFGRVVSNLRETARRIENSPGSAS